MAGVARITAPGSALATSEFVADILATDGAACVGLGASLGEGRFADEIAIVAGLRQPLAILQGSGEQLVSLDYLRKLTIPALWRADERQVTMYGYDHPVFAEDMARGVTERLRADPRIIRFTVEAASDESIRNHGACARLAWPPRR